MPGSHRQTTCHICKSEGISHCFHCRGFGTDKCTGCRGTGMKAGVAHPALYSHPIMGGFPNSETNPNIGYQFSNTAIRPALLGKQFLLITKTTLL